MTLKTPKLGPVTDFTAHIYIYISLSRTHTLSLSLFPFLYVCLSLSLSLYIYIYIYINIYPSISQTDNQSVNQSVNQSITQSVSWSICVCLCLSVRRATTNVQHQLVFLVQSKSSSLSLFKLNTMFHVGSVYQFLSFLLLFMSIPFSCLFWRVSSSNLQHLAVKGKIRGIFGCCYHSKRAKYAQPSFVKNTLPPRSIVNHIRRRIMVATSGGILSELIQEPLPWNPRALDAKPSGQLQRWKPPKPQNRPDIQPRHPNSPYNRRAKNTPKIPEKWPQNTNFVVFSWAFWMVFWEPPFLCWGVFLNFCTFLFCSWSVGSQL